MPIGVMADALSVALGGLTGAVCCKRISEEMKEKLTLIFGLCSMGIGISVDCLYEKSTRGGACDGRRNGVGRCAADRSENRMGVRRACRKC